MRKKETPPILLYSLSDDKIEQLVSDYIDYVSNPYHIWRQTEEWTDREFSNIMSMRRDMPAPNVALAPEKQPLRVRGDFDSRDVKYTLAHKPQRDKTEFKFRALVDLVYRRFAASKRGWFSLNKLALSLVFDEGYVYMITALSRHDIISGESNPITIPHPEWFVCSQYRYAASVIPYRDKVGKVIRESYRKRQQTIISTAAVGESASAFLQQYEQNVGRIQFVDTTGLNAYMSNPNNFSEPHRKLYFQAVIDRVSLKSGYTYADKCMVSSGKNEEKNHIGRFYHIATSLPKELKPFTNIQYGIDAHNSHPLLFNYLIFNYFLNNSLIDIDFSFLSITNSKLYYYISLYLSKNPIAQPYHYVLGELCKYLKDNNIIQDKAQLAKIPIDALRYIQDTTTGQIWDKVQREFPQFTRGEVKQYMFRHVFYSYATRTGYYDFRSRQYVEMDRKEWVDMFKHCYPSVLTLINRIKKDIHSQCVSRSMIDKDGKDIVQLPHLLMRFESVLFTRALISAFKAGIPVIGIHDCIALVDSSDTIDSIQQQRLVDIVNEQYMEVGLVPSLSIEQY